MTRSGVSVEVLKDNGDARGSSFMLPPEALRALGAVADMHATTLVPGAVRGDHFHVTRRELLLVMHGDAWSLHWDDGEGTAVRRRRFEGAGMVLVTVPRLSSHAVVNEGAEHLRIIGMTDGPYDPAAPDAFPRPVSGV